MIPTIYRLRERAALASLAVRRSLYSLKWKIWYAVRR